VNQAELEARLRERLADAPPQVTAAYLFGSRARGTSGPASDVDVAALLDRAPEPSLAGRLLPLEGDLERSVGAAVQLVILNDAPPDLVHRVLRDGRILLDRDRSARIRFEVKARNEYFDTQPIRDRYRRATAGKGLGKPG
jgi:predicted nucleotidyltransferase